MPLDPMIAGMLAQQPAWPPARSLSVSQLREGVRAGSTMLPPPAGTLAVVADREIPGAAGELRVRIYKPEGTRPFPVVVYFHGGGFVAGDLDTQDMVARGLALGADAVVVSVDYRLAPEFPFPAGADDCLAAPRWVASHAAEIGGDPARIAVAGDSAGGVLANGVALAALKDDKLRIAGVVNWYGPAVHPVPEDGSMAEFADGPILTADDVRYFHELYISDPAQDGDPRVSAVKAADHAGLPPHFIATAELDPIRDAVEAYVPVLRAAGVEVETKRYAGMPHGFVSWLGFLPGAQEAMADACKFLKRVFVTS